MGDASTCAGPLDVTIDPAQKHLYVSCLYQVNSYLINNDGSLASQVAVATFTNRIKKGQIRFSQNSKTVYILDHIGNAHIYQVKDDNQLKALTTVDLSFSNDENQIVSDIILNPAENKLYVSSYSGLKYKIYSMDQDGVPINGERLSLKPDGIQKGYVARFIFSDEGNYVNVLKQDAGLKPVNYFERYIVSPTNGSLSYKSLGKFSGSMLSMASFGKNVYVLADEAEGNELFILRYIERENGKLVSTQGGEYIENASHHSGELDSNRIQVKASNHKLYALAKETNGKNVVLSYSINDKGELALDKKVDVQGNAFAVYSKAPLALD